MARPVEQSRTGEWPVTWEAHRRAQLREVETLSPEQRLRWLEDAIEFAYRAGALARARAREESG